MNQKIHIRASLTLPPLSVCIILMAIMPSAANAEDIIWTGIASDGLWKTTSNWDPARASTNADTVIINEDGNLTINMDESATVGNLTFGESSLGTIKIAIGSGITGGTIRLNLGETNGTQELHGKISVLAGHHEIIGRNSNAGDLLFTGRYDHSKLTWDIVEDSSLTLTNVHIRASNANGSNEKTGRGLLVLAGDNVGTANPWKFSRFNITEGTVKIAHNRATGDLANNYLVSTGATLELAAGYYSVNGTLTLNGGGIDGSGALYNSEGSNTIDEGTGTIALASDSVINVAGDSTLTIKQDISGGGKLTKNGLGTLHLAQTTTANAFTGGMTINAGTVRVSHENALGTGITSIETDGILKIDGGVIIENQIKLKGGRVVRDIIGGEKISFGTNQSIISSIIGGFETGAQIMDSQVVTSDLSIEYAFSNNSTAINDAIRASDIITISGTGTNIYVLQLEISATVDANYQLGWLDSSNEWVSATSENSQLGASALLSVVGAFSSSGASATTDYLGSWGYDADAGVLWAIIDHDGTFSMLAPSIPEPTSAAFIIGILALFSIAFSRMNRSANN